MSHLPRSPRTTAGDSRGYTLLEQVLVLPVLLGLVFGAIDLSRAVQGYAALQEGVQGAIRCTFTTDGACVAALNEPGEAWYHWYTVEPTARYPYNLVDYRGEGRWLGQTRRVWDRARVLDTVHWDRRSYLAERSVYSIWTAAGQSVRRTRMPYLTGADGENPGFRYRQAPGSAYPQPHTVSPTSGNVLSPGHPEVVIDLPMIPPPPLPASACNLSADFDEPLDDSEEPPPDSGSSCDLGAPWSAQFHGILWVEGEARGTGHSGAGDPTAVTLRLNGVNTEDLGGQAFRDFDEASWVPANFVPRGARVSGTANENPADNYVAPLLKQRHAELTTYAMKVKLWYGNGSQRIILRKSGTWPESFRYRVTKVSIYPPEYGVFTTTQSCTFPASTYDPATSQCPVPAGTVITDFNRPPLEAPTTVPCAASMSHAWALSGRSPEQYTLTPGAPCSAGSQACPPPGALPSPPATLRNIGVAAPADTTGRINAPNATARQMCPLTDPVLREHGVEPAFWREAEEPLPPAERVTWLRATCTEPQPPLPAYPKLSAPGVTVADFYPATTSDPHTDPAYGCPDFPRRTLVLDDPADGGEVELPSTSRFLGTHPEQTPECVGAVLREAAIAEGHLDPRAWFSWSHALEGIGAYAAAPADHCLRYEMTFGTSAARTLLTASGPLPWPERPAPCTSGAVCVRELAHLSGSTGSTTIDEARAELVHGFQEVAASYPPARYDCEGRDCVKLAVSTTGTTRQVEGSIEIPLMLLFGRTMKLEYAEQRRIESTFVR